MADPGDDDVTWREKMERAILNIPLNITALLGEPIMSMGQLIRLKPGDVVPIQINEGIEVRVEDNAIFLAEIGEVSGQVAVSLSRPTSAFQGSLRQWQYREGVGRKGAPISCARHVHVSVRTA